jgi:hypothetical protein
MLLAWECVYVWDLCFIVFDELRSVFYILLSFVWLFI